MKNRFYFVLFLFLVYFAACTTPKATQPAITPKPIEPLNTGPTKTPVPSPTSAPTAVPTSGTSLTMRDDGSTLFTDYDGKFILVFPPGWRVVRVNQKELIQLEVNEAVQDPNLQALLSEIKLTDQDVFRATGLDLRSEHRKSDYIARIVIILDISEKTTPSKEIEKIKTELSSENATQITSQIGSTPSGYDFAVADAMSPELTMANGTKVHLYLKYAAFTPQKDKFLLINMYVPKDLKSVLEPEFDQLVQSFEEIMP
jgi:hypothetical protein